MSTLSGWFAETFLHHRYLGESSEAGSVWSDGVPMRGRFGTALTRLSGGDGRRTATRSAVVRCRLEYDVNVDDRISRPYAGDRAYRVVAVEEKAAGSTGRPDHRLLVLEPEHR